MEIECKNCHYKYDFKLYGEQCPQCRFENKPFRSQSARRMMGYSDDSFRSYRFNDNRAERREELLRSGDPDYGKSPLRRVRRYIMIVALCFAVLMLGRAIMRMSHIFSAPEGPAEKPLVSDLASAAYHSAFNPTGGVNLLVRYVGTVPDEQLGKQQRGKVLCVFVDVSASLEAEAPDSFPGAILVRLDDQVYAPKSPKADGANLSNYTAFRFRELRQYGYAAGQFFFYLPLETETFDLCWRDEQHNTEQRMTLRVSMPDAERNVP